MMQLKQKCEAVDLEFDDIFYDRCEKYITLLKQWGKVHNLSSNKDLQQEAIELNILDSIYVLKFLSTYTSIADVGTGAGYPGMLLAIARPDISCTLIEPRAKRVAFLKFVSSFLKLTNIKVIEKRAEDISNEKYDLIVSRAVTNTSLLLDITKDISNEHTQYLFYKGSLAQNELEVSKINNYDVISFGEHRNYVYIRIKNDF